MRALTITMPGFVKPPVDLMIDQTSDSGSSSKHGWGLGLFAAATATLLGCVWTGHPLGTPLVVAVLTGLGVGGLLIALGLRREDGRPLGPATTDAPMPVPAATHGIPPHLEKVLAEIAVLAWKISKRVQNDSSQSKPILRNSTRIIEMLGEHRLELVSYEGRKIDMGSRVQVQEAVEGAVEDKVLAEHEPEIQINGKLARKALVTVGKGNNTASGLSTAK